MLEQAFTQMREVSIRVSWRRYAFVHLHDLDVLPRYFFVC